ncbi:hypothetical protein BDN72DRAFT_753204, partial [Pluteus cervinus]
LVSLGKLDQIGWSWCGMDNQLVISNREGHVVATIPRTNGVYRIVQPSHLANAAETVTPCTLYELHCNLGHVSYQYLKLMVRLGLIKGIKLIDNEETPCTSCQKGKIRRSPIHNERVSPSATSFGDHFHIDIWGPATIQTVNHHRYALTIVDD